MSQRALRRIGRWTIPALVLGLFAVGCDDSPTNGDFEDGDGSLSVYLTDAPGDVQDVWVQVNDVQLVGQGQPISLLDEATDLINLLDLQDEAIALAEDVEVEAGNYTQVRFILGGAVLESTDGGVYTFGGAEHPDGLDATGTLMCPSCPQTGIKVRLPGGVTIEEGENAGLLMDFDVSQSFGRRAGASGMWVMHPVILGAAADPGSIEGGEVESTISGTVGLDTDVTVPTCGGEERTLEEFVPLATATTLTDEDGEALSFSGETDGDGEFEIEVLGADTYDLGFKTETVFESEKLVWDATVDPDEVTVEADDADVGGVSYTVTSVTCEPTS